MYFIYHYLDLCVLNLSLDVENKEGKALKSCLSEAKNTLKCFQNIS